MPRRTLLLEITLGSSFKQTVTALSCHITQHKVHRKLHGRTVNPTFPKFMCVYTINETDLLGVYLGAFLQVPHPLSHLKLGHLFI